MAKIVFVKITGGEMAFKDGQIEGVVIKNLNKYNDSRGWLIELFRHDGMDYREYPVMSYISETKAGVARGPHEHVDQTDYFCFIGPSTFRLFLWDARKDSPTLGNKIMADYGENNPAAVVVPPGVVHGYKNIGDKNGWVFNAANRLYAGWDKKEDVDEIRHEEMDSPYVIE